MYNTLDIIKSVLIVKEVLKNLKDLNQNQFKIHQHLKQKNLRNLIKKVLNKKKMIRQKKNKENNF